MTDTAKNIVIHADERDARPFAMLAYDGDTPAFAFASEAVRVMDLLSETGKTHALVAPTEYAFDWAVRMGLCLAIPSSAGWHYRLTEKGAEEARVILTPVFVAGYPESTFVHVS